LGGDDREEREAASFEKTKKESGCHQAAVVVSGGHACLSDAPAKAEDGHENAVRDLDDEEGGERLPGELGDGRDGSDRGILVAGEVGVFLQTEDGAVA
jgi:hypothetical protein